MIQLVLGLVLLGLLFGGRRVLTATWAALTAWGRGPLGYWRPVSGLGAVVMLTLALVLLVREDWLPAAAFALIAGSTIRPGLRRSKPPIAALSAASTPTSAAPRASPPN